jgi:hypothetical protein
MYININHIIVPTVVKWNYTKESDEDEIVPIDPAEIKKEVALTAVNGLALAILNEVQGGDDKGNARRRRRGKKGR